MAVAVLRDEEVYIDGSVGVFEEGVPEEGMDD